MPQRDLDDSVYTGLLAVLSLWQRTSLYEKIGNRGSDSR